mmetsp:Transcript_63368/g.169449  ORF Transcript_63368/g.169449 Transcript_63368/m.169449 type:complete len:80 (-) Transcript_63368:903-1142(-)
MAAVMNFFFAMLWYIPQFVLKVLFGSRPLPLSCGKSLDDMPVFQNAELTEIREKRSVNLLAYPKKREIYQVFHRVDRIR